MPPSDRNRFEEEKDLEAWAEELSTHYTPGAQGGIGQPMREMSDETLSAAAGMIEAEIREESDLPAIVDEAEAKLHRTQSEIDAMSDIEHVEWAMDAAEWLMSHPKATIDILIDPEE